MSEAVDTWEEVVALAPHQETTLSAIRALVRDLHPEATEVARPGDRAVSWGWGPRKMSEAYCYAIPYPAHVNLGLYQGATLPDPERRLEGTGKSLRHVKLRAASEVSHPSIRALLLAARDERRAALNL